MIHLTAAKAENVHSYFFYYYCSYFLCDYPDNGFHCIYYELSGYRYAKYADDCNSTFILSFKRTKTMILFPSSKLEQLFKTIYLCSSLKKLSSTELSWCAGLFTGLVLFKISFMHTLHSTEDTWNACALCVNIKFCWYCIVLSSVSVPNPRPPGIRSSRVFTRFGHTNCVK